MEEKVLETEWLPLSTFEGMWIFGMGDMKPIKTTPEFCKQNNISVWDLKRFDKMGLLFYSKEDAEKTFITMMDKVSLAKQYREAMDAWWDPENYYKISKR